jgi:sRNA-binding regulator protein Hfq
MQSKSRGALRTVQCTNWKALKCGCKLVYEHALDENYYLRDASIDDHGATCRIISPEKAAEDMAMDLDSAEGSHLKQYKPAPVRNEGERFRWRRSQKEIRATLMQKCPDAPARVDALLGPFATPREIIQACKAWSWHPALQPEGVFDMSYGNLQKPGKRVGEQRTVQCTNWKALKCGCKLVYEHAIDENYYLRNANLDDHGATCRIISPEKAAENMATAHLRRYKPASVRNEVGRPRRSQKEIRATLMQKCPDAPARVDALLGPFATPREIIQACKAWSWHPALQPEGVFDMSYGNLQKPGKRVGEQRTVQCTNWKALKCGCKLVYEHAIDENYYLRNANLDDHGATCRIIRPESATENTVCGKNEIPEHFFSYAKQLKRDGLGITAIHTALCEKAEEESVAVTWKMGGLYYQLDKVFPRERKRVSKWSLAKKSRPESTRRTFTKVEKSKK